MEGKSDQQSTEKTPTLAETIASHIGSQDEYETKTDDTQSPESQVASDPENPEGKPPTASEDGTPTTETGEAGKETAKADESKDGDPAKPAEGDATAEATTDEAKAKADAEAEADAAVAAYDANTLGTSLGAGTDPSITDQRYRDACDRLRVQDAEAESIRQCLADGSVQVVNTKDGPKLAMTAEALAELPIEESVNRAINSMPPNALAEALGDQDAAMKMVQSVSKQVIADLLPQRPATSATTQDAVLSENEIGRIWDDFVGAKGADGKAVYTDADKQDVQDEMNMIAGTPKMAGLAELADTNAVARQAFQHICYLSAKERRTIRQAILADTTAISEQKKNEIKQEVSVTPAGSATPVKGQETGAAPKTPGAIMADMITEEMSSSGGYEQ